MYLFFHNFVSVQCSLITPMSYDLLPLPMNHFISLSKPSSYIPAFVFVFSFCDPQILLRVACTNME